MAFGVTDSKTNQISRSKTYSADTALMLNNVCKKINGTTHGAQKEVSEEFYVAGTDSFTNLVVEGRTGTNLVTNCALNESNQDYAKYTVTRTILPDDSSYSL